MKIQQDQEFQPIIITLETKREAEAFWEMIEGYHEMEDTLEEQIIKNLSDFFSNHAQL